MWPDEDQGYALALEQYEALLNSSGIPIDEATSKDADPDNRKGAYKYVAESVIDHSARAVSEHLKSFGEKDENRDARIVRVRRVERPARPSRK